MTSDIGSDPAVPAVTEVSRKTFIDSPVSWVTFRMHPSCIGQKESSGAGML